MKKNNSGVLLSRETKSNLIENAFSSIVRSNGFITQRARENPQSRKLKLILKKEDAKTCEEQGWKNIQLPIIRSNNFYW